MKKALLAFAILTLCLGLPSAATGQNCGDANEDGHLDIADLVTILDYICHPHSHYPFDMASADLDGRVGITIGDVAEFSDYLFAFSGQELTCSPAGDYVFLPTEDDTVFFPYMTDIHSRLKTVELQVLVSLGPSTRAYYVPFFGSHVTNDAFQLTDMTASRETFIVGNAVWMNGSSLTDTAVVIASARQPGSPSKITRINAMTLEYIRVNEGDGSDLIDPYPVNRDSNWKIVVEKDDGLYIPVIEYFEIAQPIPDLSADNASLDYVSIAGEQSPNPATIDFTATLMPVEFRLIPSDPWIIIEDPAMDILTTPVTVTVRADATDLEAGKYTGQIEVVPYDPIEANLLVGAIEVTFMVGENPSQVPGDVTCNGEVTIADVALLIDCLFINVRPVPPCE